MASLTVLYGHSSGLIGGGNVVLLRLFSSLRETHFNPISVVPHDGPLTAELGRAGVPHLTMDLRPRSSVYSLMTVTRLMLWKRKHGVALVHANDPAIYRQLSLVHDARTRICHIHHPDVNARMLGWSFQRPPVAIVVPTTYVASQVAACLPLALRHVPIHVVGNPIDTDWFAPLADVRSAKERLGLPPDCRHVSIIASLSRHKGHECFLRMARRILDVMPHVRFSIVGGTTADRPEYGGEIKRQAEALGIARHVTLWGRVDDRTARDIMGASDLFVLPSKEEGFGLVLAEAQACGVPVLTTNIAPLPEILQDGRTGYCLKPDDDLAFASRALELLRDPSARARMAAAGRPFVLERFGMSAYGDRLTRIYDDVMAAAEWRKAS